MTATPPKTFSMTIDRITMISNLPMNIDPKFS
jgi:hypothetical protein